MTFSASSGSSIETTPLSSAPRLRAPPSATATASASAVSASATASAPASPSVASSSSVAPSPGGTSTGSNRVWYDLDVANHALSTHAHAHPKGAWGRSLAIGMITVYLVLALSVTAFNEAIAATLSSRAKS